jgi:hypothetical protein
MPSRNFFVTADDFGITKRISDGMMHLAQKGVIHRLSLLTNMPGTSHALNLAKENLSVPIGLHFNLTEGRPISDACKSLLSPSGHFISRGQLLPRLMTHSISRDEIRGELMAQFEVIRKAGIQVAYLDSHQHIHVLPLINKVFQEFAIQHSLTIRNPLPMGIRSSWNLSHVLLNLLLALNPIPGTLLANQTLASVFDLGKAAIEVKDYYSIKTQFPAEGIHELMVHPYVKDDEGLLEVYEQEGFKKKSGFLKIAYQEHEILNTIEALQLLG